MFNEYDYLRSLLLNVCNNKGLYSLLRERRLSIKDHSKFNMKRNELEFLIGILLNADVIKRIDNNRFELSDKVKKYDLKTIRYYSNSNDLNELLDSKTDFSVWFSYIKISVDTKLNENLGHCINKLLDDHQFLYENYSDLEMFFLIEKFVSMINDIIDNNQTIIPGFEISDKIKQCTKDFVKRELTNSIRYVFEYSPYCKPFLSDEIIYELSNGRAEYVDLTNKFNGEKFSVEKINQLISKLDISSENVLFINVLGEIEKLNEITNNIIDICFFNFHFNENEKIDSDFLLGLLSDKNHAVPYQFITYCASLGWFSNEGDYMTFKSDIEKSVYAAVLKLDHREYSVRFINDGDIEKLVEIDKLCWGDGMTMSQQNIINRINKYPQGQFALELNGKLIGSAYSQKIADMYDIFTSNSDDILQLHDDDGKIVQLISVNIHPDFQNKAYGDILLEFLLHIIHFSNFTNDVVAVTRYSDYIKYKDVCSISEYIDRKEKNGLYTDGLLRFHQIHGAQIKFLVKNYRNGDVVNEKNGVLVQYDLTERKRIDSINNEAEVVENNRSYDKDSVFSRIKELFEEEISISLDNECDTPFMELGIDSIALYSLKITIGEEYRLNLPTNFFFTYGTLNDVVKRLTDMLSKNENEKNNIKDYKKFEKKCSNYSGQCAIIGVALRLPNGINDIDSMWKAFEKGESITLDPCRDAVKKMYTEKELSNYKGIEYGGYLEEIDKFDNNFFNISNREAIELDPQLRLLLEVSYECFENAGILLDELKGSDTGVFVGASSSDYIKLYNRSGKVGPNYGVITSNSMLANRLSYYFDIHGPSQVIDTACSSSLTSLHNAVMSVKNGDCKMALVAGINLICEPSLSKGYYEAGMLSPDGKCKAFDDSANGYVRSEGLISILIKDYEQALNDEDPILGIIMGDSVNHGGRTSGITVPNSDYQADLITTAINRSNLTPSDISLIEAHGTGTSLGDPIEIEGLLKVFSDDNIDKKYCAIGSAKSVFGHMEAASGLLSVLKVISCMKNKKIPKIASFEKLNSKITTEIYPFYIPERTVEWSTDDIHSKRIAGVSNFGSGGANAHVVLCEPESKSTEKSITRKYYLICLSAISEESLKIQEANLVSWLKEKSDFTIGDLEYNLINYRNSFSYRSVYIVSEIEELLKSIEDKTNGSKCTNYYVGNVNEKRNQPIFVNMGENILNEIKNGNEDYSAFTAAAELYVCGYINDFKKLYSEKYRKIDIPAYKFDHSRSFWLNDEYVNVIQINEEKKKDCKECLITNQIIKNNIGNKIVLNDDLNTDDIIEKNPIILECIDDIDEDNQIKEEFTTIPMDNDDNLNPVENKSSASYNSSSEFGDIRDYLIKALSEVLYVEPCDISTDSKFVDIGLDSILSVEWVKKINKQYGIDLTATKVYDYPTINDFEELVIEKLSSSNNIINEKKNEISRIKLKKDVTNDTPVFQGDVSAIKCKILDLLSACLYCEKDGISYDQKFVDLGLDSVLGVEFVKNINALFALKLSASIIYDYCCINDLSQYILNLKNSENAITKIEKQYETIEDVLNAVQNGELEYEEAEKIIDRLNNE